MNDGGPAFPLSIATGPAGDLYSSTDLQDHEGMSLRDYCALKVFAEFAAYSARCQQAGEPYEAEFSAREALKWADAYIAARETTHD